MCRLNSGVEIPQPGQILFLGTISGILTHTILPGNLRADGFTRSDVFREQSTNGLQGTILSRSGGSISTVSESNYVFVCWPWDKPFVFRSWAGVDIDAYSSQRALVRSRSPQPFCPGEAKDTSSYHATKEQGQTILEPCDRVPKPRSRNQSVTR